jgi:hypothetical protein
VRTLAPRDRAYADDTRGGGASIMNELEPEPEPEPEPEAGLARKRREEAAVLGEVPVA